jgi:hypothetical protein
MNVMTRRCAAPAALECLLPHAKLPFERHRERGGERLLMAGSGSMA